MKTRTCQQGICFVFADNYFFADFHGHLTTMLGSISTDGAIFLKTCLTNETYF